MSLVEQVWSFRELTLRRQFVARTGLRDSSGLDGEVVEAFVVVRLLLNFAIERWQCR